MGRFGPRRLSLLLNTEYEIRITNQLEAVETKFTVNYRIRLGHYLHIQRNT